MRSIQSYIITRIVLTIPMLFVLFTVVFVILHVMPGDPVRALVRPGAPQEYVDQLRAELGLDKPLTQQYIDYLWNLAHGRLGRSMVFGRRPVVDEILDRFPATVELSVFSMLITMIVGISTGAFAAHHRKSSVDYGLRIWSTVIYAVPIFWLGLMLQLVFSVYLGWFPVAGRIGAELSPQHITGLYVVDSILTGNMTSLVSALKHLALPSITLGLILSGIFTRMTRANMLDVLRQDYITAERARGLPERVVVYRHALKNAFIPILTLMALQFALLLAGAILTETTFSWPGLGRLLVERITYRDFPMIQGSVVFFAVLVASVSLIVDIVYAYIDPRIRL
jgi:peptide/nickel transport system permease protein